jgi:hypothetical protein
VDGVPDRRPGADGARGRKAVMEIVLIVAVADNGVIGAGGTIPWRLKSDLQRFKTMTLGKPVVMGRKTFISLNQHRRHPRRRFSRGRRRRDDLVGRRPRGCDRRCAAAFRH